MVQLVGSNGTSLDGLLCHLISKSSQIKLHGLLCLLKKEWNVGIWHNSGSTKVNFSIYFSISQGKHRLTDLCRQSDGLEYIRRF